VAIHLFSLDYIKKEKKPNLSAKYKVFALLLKKIEKSRHDVRFVPCNRSVQNAQSVTMMLQKCTSTDIRDVFVNGNKNIVKVNDFVNQNLSLKLK